MATRFEWNLRLEEANNRIVRNTKEAQQAVDDFFNAVMGDTKDAVIAAINDCYARLIERTPVETGRARMSWHIAGKPDEWKPEPGDYARARHDIQAVIAEQLGKLPLLLSQADVVYIMSNLEYMLPLEAGWSKKQEGGFIALFLAELKTTLEAAAKRSRAGAVSS